LPTLQPASYISYLKDLDRDIVISMLLAGDVSLEVVQVQRDDISAADVA
jgi:hypothetical protein